MRAVYAFLGINGKQCNRRGSWERNEYFSPRGMGSELLLYKDIPNAKTQYTEDSYFRGYFPNLLLQVRTICFLFSLDYFKFVGVCCWSTA